MLLIPPVSFSVIMFLSNPVFGVTPKYYSVGQCVSLLTISKDITGTDKLNELMEECEKIMTLRHFKWKYRMDSDKCSERDVEKTLDFEGLPSGSEENIHVR